jgi:hypothetical protein
MHLLRSLPISKGSPPTDHKRERQTPEALGALVKADAEK